MAEQPSRQVLDGIPTRVLTFLIGVGKYFPIRAALASRGYTETEHERAWGLLKKLAIYPDGSGPGVDKAVRDAIIELDAWDEPNFAILRAVLQSHHPEVVDFVFANLGPKQGPESVMSVSILLSRLDALESAPERLATRTADLAALATLAARGYTHEERARLGTLVGKAQNVAVTKPISDEEREKTLLDLYGWHNEWSTIARVVLTRRDHQIQVGIAKRRKAKKDDASSTTPAPPATPPTTSPVPPATPPAPPTTSPVPPITSSTTPAPSATSSATAATSSAPSEDPATP
jgi:hypothetical protein